jgi:plasmid stability protein
MQYDGMAVTGEHSIQIRHVPGDVHTVLRRRAAEEGKSMQEYVLSLLVEQARRPTVREMLDRIGSRSGGRIGLREAAEQIRAERDAR